MYGHRTPSLCQHSTAAKLHTRLQTHKTNNKTWKEKEKHIHINHIPAARLALHRVTTGSSGDSFSRDKIYLILIASVSFQIK